MRSLVALLLTALSSFGCLSSAPVGGAQDSSRSAESSAQAVVERWSTDQLRARRDDPELLLVNVLVPSQGSIPGTDANLSHERIDELATLVGPNRDRQVVLYCRTTRKAALAAEALLKRGHRKVAILDGGIVGWKAAGHPVE